MGDESQAVLTGQMPSLPFAEGGMVSEEFLDKLGPIWGWPGWRRASNRVTERTLKEPRNVRQKRRLRRNTISVFKSQALSPALLIRVSEGRAGPAAGAVTEEHGMGNLLWQGYELVRGSGTLSLVGWV